MQSQQGVNKQKADTWHWAGMEPSQHWWEATSLTTAGYPCSLTGRGIVCVLCEYLSDYFVFGLKSTVKELATSSSLVRRKVKSIGESKS